MLAGLITGTIVDLPVIISWGFSSYSSGSPGLKFIVYYNVVMFSLIFTSLTLFSTRLIKKLNEKQNSIQSISAQIRNLILMVASFDFTFLLWVCYYAFLVPNVVSNNLKGSEK